MIILESPHVNEYDPITKAAIGPAMGKTGCNFEKYFDTIIKNSKIYNSICNSYYDIVLINSVQYQCSLGLPLSKYSKLRNTNWISCFNGGNLSTDLENRLTALNPSFIINLCTEKLRQYVSNYIMQGKIISPYKLTDGNHPVSWTNPAFRIIK